MTISFPNRACGKDEYKNLQLLHRHCHDEKTAKDSKRYACLASSH
ncbi:HNH endonuclease signature motif containing protein [Fischerella sp. PCC 9605]|nr:HNH endonuclease signature motif containing protein [Fischerella sp. PCC 9605]